MSRTLNISFLLGQMHVYDGMMSGLRSFQHHAPLKMATNMVSAVNTISDVNRENGSCVPSEPRARQRAKSFLRI